MRSLNRQKVTICYAKYASYEEIQDEDGNYTGEIETIREEPKMASVTMGSVSGIASLRPYGFSPEYNRVMISDDPNCPIDENTVLWVDNSTDEENDYIVVGVIRTLNCVGYAIKKVL